LNTRYLLILLVLAATTMAGQLLLTESGFAKTSNLRDAVSAQRAENETLKKRNAALQAEVDNLNHGQAAAEERARTDLGMIGSSETFYQVVPAAGVAARKP